MLDPTITVTPCPSYVSVADQKAERTRKRKAQVKEPDGRRMVYEKKQSLKMLCEWGGCNQEFNDVDILYKHIKLHIHEATINNNNEVPEECVWTGCQFCHAESEQGASEMVRHIFFHAFHARLKSLGNSFLERFSWEPCRLDESTRNVIPELPDTLVCGWEYCEAIHDSPDYFYKHVSFHAEDETVVKCLWNGCGTSFSARFRLKDHLRSHTQEKTVACPTCGALFANRTKFQDHLTRQQAAVTKESNLAFECSHCNRSFASNRLLRNHMRHHVNHYQCEHCEMTCTTPASLRSHIRYRHTSVTPHRCTECNYAAKKPADLRKHLETHVPPDFFKCQVADCDYSTKTYQSLTKHYERRHEENTRFECHLCKERFILSDRLTAHLQTKHDFTWPAGHKRFKYKVDVDGVHRLQMIRYESVELAVIPEEKIISSLQRDGLEINQLEPNPPRQKFKEVKKRKRTSKKKKNQPTSEDQPNAEYPQISFEKAHNVFVKIANELGAVNGASCPESGVSEAEIHGAEGEIQAEAFYSYGMGPNGELVPCFQDSEGNFLPVPAVVVQQGLPPTTGIAGTLPTGTLPTGTLPTGTLPTGTLPTGTLPACTLPTGALPTGALPTGTLPACTLPTCTLPTGTLPTGTLPTGALPTGALLTGTLPTCTLPTGTLPTGTLPSGTLPTGTLLTGTLPTGTLPTGSLPTGTLPTGALPTGTLPIGTLPTGTLPIGTLPTGTLPTTDIACTLPNMNNSGTAPPTDIVSNLPNMNNAVTGIGAYALGVDQGGTPYYSNAPIVGAPSSAISNVHIDNLNLAPSGLPCYQTGVGSGTNSSASTSFALPVSSAYTGNVRGPSTENYSFMNNVFDSYPVVQSSSVPSSAVTSYVTTTPVINAVVPESLPRKISDQENLEMLGEVALGFSGLFPKNDSPVKFWRGDFLSPEGFESPVKTPSQTSLRSKSSESLNSNLNTPPKRSDCEASDVLNTPPKQGSETSEILETPPKVDDVVRNLSHSDDPRSRRKSPRKSNKPRKYLSYADHVMPTRNVLG